MKLPNAILAASLALGLAASAYAHHSTNGIYDETTEVELVGTVVQWRFINPHPTLSIEVEGDNGPEVWDVSYGGSAVAHLSRRGFKADTFKPGDRIKVHGFIAKAAGAHGMLVRGNPTNVDGSLILPAPPAPPAP